MTAVPAEKKKRSALERTVVWGFIVLLALVVGLEYRGMTGYNQTLTLLEEKLEECRINGTGLTLAEAKSMAKMSPAYTTPTEKGAHIETVAKWFTVLSFLPNRKYAIHIEVDKVTEDAHVISLNTAGKLDEQLSDKPITLDPASIPPAPATNEQRGAGAPPGGGGGQRPQRPGDDDDQAALGGGLDMGLIGKLLDPEVQKSLEFSDDQMESIGGLKNEVIAGLGEIHASTLRGNEKQPLLDDFVQTWMTKAETIIGGEGIDELRKLADPSGE